MKPLMLAVAVSAGLGAVSATQMPTGPGPTGDRRIVPVTAPSGVNSAQPQMTVSPRGILLSWIERAGTRATLKFAERTRQRLVARDHRRRRGRLVRQLGRRAVGRAPRRRDAGRALAAEERRRDLRLRRAAVVLHGRRKTWSPSFTPHHDGTKREHGFASLFQMPAPASASSGSTAARWNRPRVTTRTAATEAR